MDFKGKRFELYDMTSDLGETNDIADRHPEIVAAMKTELREWVASVEESRLGYDYLGSDVAASNTVADPKKTHLFLLSGQSNMKNLAPDISFTPALKSAFPSDKLITNTNTDQAKP